MAVVLISVCAVVIVIIFTLYLSIHRVDEGHVAVYFRGGALMENMSDPGFNIMLPFVTTYDTVQVTLQTDKVLNIPCGTSGGVIIYFEQIEVVNKLDKSAAHSVVKEFTVGYDKILIFDKVHHELNQFCSVHTLQEVYIDLFDKIDEYLEKALQDGIDQITRGLHIDSVRVTKPKIPESVRKNYERVENEISKFLVAEQHENLVLKDSETGRKKAVIEAQKEADISKIRNDQKILEKRAEKQVQQVANEMYASRVRSDADAQFYSHSKLAHSNQMLLSLEYMLLKFYESMSNCSKIYFGPDIPQVMSQHHIAVAPAGPDNG